MNINDAQKGYKVIVDVDILNVAVSAPQKQVKKYLKLDKTYTVKSTRTVGHFGAEVALREIPGQFFNIVFFKSATDSSNKLPTVVQTKPIMQNTETAKLWAIEATSTEGKTTLAFYQGGTLLFADSPGGKKFKARPAPALFNTKKEAEEARVNQKPISKAKLKKTFAKVLDTVSIKVVPVYLMWGNTLKGFYAMSNIIAKEAAGHFEHTAKVIRGATNAVKSSKPTKRRASKVK